MAERTVRMAYITYHDDEGVPWTATQGQTVDTSEGWGEGEEDRLNEMGAFEDSPPIPQDTVSTYLSAGTESVDRESGLEHEGPPDEVPEEEDETLQAEGNYYGDARTGAERAAELEGDGDGQENPAPEQENPAPQPGSTPSETQPSDPGSSGGLLTRASDEEIDSLSGPALDEACAQAGIDTSTGGSLSNGAMSADEKRAALKAAR